MLFDEKDFNVFDNNDSKMYFKEILQAYYSQNYRAAVVLLYSFVLYDLFNKIQQMAIEGDVKAQRKLDELNTMIVDEEKYSKVESYIIDFFNQNCSLYFNRFTEDMEYLKNCRNKSAHLKVNDNSLFIPKDYQVRMLICSMFDNILSVKAPFIMDLFSVTQMDVENYTSQLHKISYEGLDDKLLRDLSNKYYSRMTYDSLKKSYKTFLRLLLKSNDETALSNIYGLYVFVFTMTRYLLNNGFNQLFNEPDIDYISIINIQSLNDNESRRDALISLMLNFSIIMDKIKCDNEIFVLLANEVLSNPRNLKKYRLFYPRETDTAYDYFKKTKKLQDVNYINTLYDCLKDVNNFDFKEFMVIMVQAIPKYWGYDAADRYTAFFANHLQEMDEETIETIAAHYKNNNQCYERARHENDANKINEELKKLGIQVKL